jgi:hypothetical protein
MKSSDHFIAKLVEYNMALSSINISVEDITDHPQPELISFREFDPQKVIFPLRGLRRRDPDINEKGIMAALLLECTYSHKGKKKILERTGEAFDLQHGDLLPRRISRGMLIRMARNLHVSDAEIQIGLKAYDEIVKDELASKN